MKRSILLPLILLLTSLLCLALLLAGCDIDTTDDHTHAFGEWSVTTEASCNAKGEETRTCECGESETREIAKLAHAYGDWNVTTAATCGAEGKEKRTCKCGAYEIKEIPATGEHVLGEWNVSKEATCAEKGEEKRTCICGASEVRDIQTLSDHNYNFENKCVFCNEVLEYTETLRYELNEDGASYTVVGIDSDIIQDIVVPPYHQKLPVTAIGERAFEELWNDFVFTDKWKMFSVSIPQTVVEIKDSAFDECWSLHNVVFAHNSQLKSIGCRAFSCAGISDLKFPSSLQAIGEYAFQGCNVLLSVKIPQALTIIGNNAFDDCWKLLEIENNSSIDIQIGSSEYGGIAYYAKNVYNSLTGERKSHIDENGYEFYVDQAVCYLVNYRGDQKNIRLPDTFNGRDYTIYSGAFLLNIELENIIIPSNVMIVAKDEFVNILGKQKIYFEGNAADWGNADDDSFFDHELPRATVYYYSVEEPIEAGEYWHYDESGKPVVW